MSTTAFYVTTPIYYVNAEPHLGHAYTTIVADVAARFHRLMGHRVRFQTGTDEHGDKIVQAAAARGVEPKAYTDRISQAFRDLWPELRIEHDRFIRTTDPDHMATVQRILQIVYDKGDIYFAKYGGKYCYGCERFYADRELVDGKCPDHQVEPTYIEEENYFFRMSKYQDALIEHIRANPEFIRPERYRNEVLSFLREPLEDLCISRPKTRLAWGIELPFDSKYVTYVWFDALINYVTGLGWPGDELFDTFWPAAQHLIAKDILKPHGVYWPTMLMSAGLPLYQHLNVHGYWNVETAKMSKSLGNVVRPLDMAGIYGLDAFRYFLLREMSFGLDSNFSEELLVARYDSDLANNLGNLFSRVLNMLGQYREGRVPDAPAALDERDRELAELTREVVAAYRDHMTEFRFHRALAELWRLVSAANKYVVENEPWTLARDPEQAERLDAVLFILIDALERITRMIAPVMPGKAAVMAAALGHEGPIAPGALVEVEEQVAVPGRTTSKPGALFPRVVTKKPKAGKKADKARKTSEKDIKAELKKAPEATDEIDIDHFARLDLRVGQVVTCAPVKGADKLLHLQVDLGEAEPRSVVAGIAQHYRPDELVDRQVVVVANLKPVKLRGLLSQGMVLAATGADGRVVLVAPGAELAPGSKVR